MTDVDLKNQWLDYIRFKYESSHTYESYNNDISSFLSFMKLHSDHEREEGEEATGELLAASIRDVRSWLAHLRMENCSATTIARKLSALRSFYKFLKKGDHKIDESIFTLRSPKKPKLIPKSLTLEQVLASIKGLENGSISGEASWISLRNKAILLLTYAQGLRISEALSVTKDQVLSDSMIIKGKGSKERMIPWLSPAKEAVKAYLDNVPYEIKDGRSIFLGARGLSLGRTQFNKVLQDLRMRLNLPDHLTPHAFRHSFATGLLENGADLRVIGELLGHASLSTTQLYTKTSLAHLKIAHKNAFE